MATICSGANSVLRTGVALQAQDLRRTQFVGNNVVLVGTTSPRIRRPRGAVRVQALMDARNDPIVKEALKEPIAFLGGVFAGLLRLDLNEDPLREWIAKTAEAAGIPTEKPDSKSSDNGPDEIVIE